MPVRIARIAGHMGDDVPPNVLSIVGLLITVVLTQTGPTGSQSTRPAASFPASMPSTATSAAMTSGDPEVDTILDRLDARGRAILDLRADVVNEDMQQMPVPETNTKKGTIIFRRAQPNPLFKVVFTERTDAGIVRKDREEFVFDGIWLTELREKTRNLVKRQVVREGERIDVFKIGKGPFPLPFGQSRADMLANFTVGRLPSMAGDPPNTDHLVCVPRPTSDLSQKFKVVHFVIDRKLDLPVQMMAERAKDSTVVRVKFDRIQLNTGIAASEFQLVKPPGYEETVEPL